MKRIIKKGISFWEGEVSFGIFLFMLLVSNFVMIPLSVSYNFSAVIPVIFWFFLILTGTFVIIKNRKIMYFVQTFILIALFLWIYGFGKDLLWLDIAERISQIIFISIFLFLVLIKVFEGGIVNVRRIMGSIAGYLLIGNLFFSAYFLIYIINGPEAFNIKEGSIAAQFMYYSYVTLTSTGYGDILPVSAAARAVSNLESIMGQLYPAILIARLISLESSAKSNLNSK
ncbi:MAG: ion channel [Ignavibacteria bacterium]|nr:ion channel [Ignavibacteria bacterium]